MRGNLSHLYLEGFSVLKIVLYDLPDPIWQSHTENRKRYLLMTMDEPQFVELMSDCCRVLRNRALEPSVPLSVNVQFIPPFQSTIDADRQSVGLQSSDYVAGLLHLRRSPTIASTLLQRI